LLADSSDDLDNRCIFVGTFDRTRNPDGGSKTERRH
jgi:hypothetical protein